MCFCSRGSTLWGRASIAVALGLAWRLPRWWLPINFLFIPGLLVMQGLDLASSWYLAAFALLLLVYGGVARSQVPLYLSSQKAWHAVAGSHSGACRGG